MQGSFVLLVWRSAANPSRVAASNVSLFPLVFSATQSVLGLASGMLVGFSLGLVGGGGSILAVPLMVYVVGVPEPQRTMTAREVPSPGLDSRCTAPAGTRRKSPGPASMTTSPPGPDSSRIRPETM